MPRIVKNLLLILGAVSILAVIFVRIEIDLSDLEIEVHASRSPRTGVSILFVEQKNNTIISFFIHHDQRNTIYIVYMSKTKH